MCAHVTDCPCYFEAYFLKESRFISGAVTDTVMVKQACAIVIIGGGVQVITILVVSREELRLNMHCLECHIEKGKQDHSHLFSGGLLIAST